MNEIEIITRLINRVVLNIYPKLKISDISVTKWYNTKYYNVKLLTPKKLDSNTQEEIDTEIKNLFRMASLDSIEGENHHKNKISTWFKTPKGKDWTFNSNYGYKHI